MAQWNGDAETLIVGATFLGIGSVMLQRDNVMVVEREIVVGHEFTYAYKHGEAWDAPLRSKAASAFRDELLRRSALSEDGRAHLPGVTPALFRLIRDERLPVRLMTEVVAIEREADGFAVELYDPSGHRSIRVRRILDTTSACLSKPGHVGAIGKRINALLHTAAPEAGGPTRRVEEAEYRLDPGRFPSEAFLSIPLRPEDDWTTARAKLYAFWANRPAALKHWTLATVADQFELAPPQGPRIIEADWVWHPSAAYANPLAAMDGAVLSEMKEEAIG